MMGEIRRRRTLTIAMFMLVGALTLIALWRVRLAPAERVYTVPEIEANLARHPRQWLGRTVVVRGIVAPVDAASIYSQIHPPLPHTFVLSTPGAGAEAPQFWVAYRPGQPADGSIWATVVHFLPFLRPILPLERASADGGRYRLLLENMPRLASTCPVSTCYYARLVSAAPAFR